MIELAGVRSVRPGTRVISHMFSMGDWRPERQLEVELLPYYHVLYRWVIPARRARRTR